jgi:hemolysin activation/secretion protein
MLVVALVGALMGFHPLFAANDGLLSAQSGLYVRQLILDGLHPTRLSALESHLKQQLKGELSEDCQLNFSQSVNADVRAHQIVNQGLADNRIAVVSVNCYMTAEQIQAFKISISRYYIENHYINSGAIIPDQEVKGGVIVIRVIEGRLTDVVIENEDQLRLSSGYIKRRLKFEGDEQNILNMDVLQERLQIMQQNPLFKQIVSKVAPGKEPGDGILKVKVREADSLQIGFRFNNYRTPSVGAYRGALELNYRNLPLGWGDAFYFRYGLTEGVNDYAFNYGVPLPLMKYDTTLSLGFDKSDSEVVTEPFSELDVKSDSERWSVSLRQPFYKSYPPPDPKPQSYQEFALALKLERRRNITFLEDGPFRFSRGSIDGEMEYGVIRLSSEWLSRGQYNVFAFYNTFSFGTDALGSTTIDKSVIDNHFRTWLGQFQWFGSFKQLSWMRSSLPRLWESRLLFRTNIQLANNELLSLEKFSIGGHASVRGYRESQLIRDNGISASLEWHVPIGHLSFDDPDEGKIHLVPFVDYGRGDNKDRSTPEPKDISSVGIGMRWSPLKNVHTQFYWAKALRNISQPEDDHDLQDEGFHFEIYVNLLPWK